MMTFCLPPLTKERQDEQTDTSSSESSNDQNWDGWISDSPVQRPCQSLFDEKFLPSVEDALQHDVETHGIDLMATCSKLSLDFHARIRLINYIRKTKPPPADVAAFTGKESFFLSEQYLLPAVEDDPLLQVQSQEWSEEEEEEENLDASDPPRQIQKLERKLGEMQKSFFHYRQFVKDKLEAIISSHVLHTTSPVPSPSRYQDSHYFSSYGENDIHAIMIQDKVRTTSYAHFISTHADLFYDAIVLDVGCGTGILSLFAARSGAKKVIAVDASDIAQKARRVVEANKLGEIITVIQGKVEEISLPQDIEKVDIIVSEWMGYALLYESMLDSVLCARDRFLRPDGVMAPSQCRMMFAICDASDIFKDRVGFWNDVYGFDMSAMATDLYDDAIIDVVQQEAVLSAPCVIKDLFLNEVSIQQLDFSAPFQLFYKGERRRKVNAFVLYFDVFFTPTGLPVPLGTEVNIIHESDLILAELWPVGGKVASQRRRSTGVSRKPSTTSFTTGPQSTPTHWKQTLFLLREPFEVCEGETVLGTFYCRKSEENTRELCVEIHYSVKKETDASLHQTTVQIFSVR